MVRKDALERFKKEEAGYLKSVTAQFLTNLQEKTEELSLCLKAAFGELKEAVQEREKEPIMFIHFSLLGIDVLNGRYQVLAQAMDARWYMDTEPAEATFSIGFLFPMLEEAKERLLQDSRRYMGKVNRYDVDGLILDTAMECNRILAAVLKFVFRDIEENPEFQAIPKPATWGIRWGEYRDASETIACVDREKKEQRDWNRALKEAADQEDRMVFGFWYGAELQSSDCTGRTLCFIQFEDCTLTDMDFGGANLTGARFRGCTLKGCSFQSVNLRQADFEDCRFEGCDFTGQTLQAVYLRRKACRICTFCRSSCRRS